MDKVFFTAYFVDYIKGYDEFNPEHLAQFFLRLQ
jgi:hypothetical protein